MKKKNDVLFPVFDATVFACAHLLQHVIGLILLFVSMSDIYRALHTCIQYTKSIEILRVEISC